MAKIINKTEFNQLIQQAEGKVLVDFYAEWCGPCKMLAPILEDVENELGADKIYKVDIDADPELAQQFQVMSVPTLVTFQGGREVQRVLGVRPKHEILGMLA